MIITIDGPSGTGKSTVAKRVAQRLGFIYVDTGAMFRALAAGLLLQGISPQEHDRFIHSIQTSALVLKKDDTHMRYYFDEMEVTEYLRRLDVTELSSKISTYKEVRDKLAHIQRSLAHTGNTVFEGRDMGTVIFPEAEVKIFLTASPEIRAKRRFDELITKDASCAKTLTIEQVIQDIKNRDERDENRTLAPLKAAPDAHLIDTSSLSIEEVIEKIIVFCNLEKII